MVWNEINTDEKLNEFLELYGNFHDSCLKELRYISGAFVNQDLEMYPINDKRKLYVVFQRQCEKNSTIEIEFSSLIKLNLAPNTETYTCEILDATMFFENGYIYWGDSDWFKEEREQYDGTWLCAEKVRWRFVDKHIGDQEIYK